MSWGGVGAFCLVGAWETARAERHRLGCRYSRYPFRRGRTRRPAPFTNHIPAESAGSSPEMSSLNASATHRTASALALGGHHTPSPQTRSARTRSSAAATTASPLTGSRSPIRESASATLEAVAGPSRCSSSAGETQPMKPTTACRVQSSRVESRTALRSALLWSSTTRRASTVSRAASLVQKPRSPRLV